MTIPISKCVFGEEERLAVQKPLETGWVVQGPFVGQFEEKFSAFTSSRFSIATSSCTTALHLAVAALGLKTGDEVIVPAFTWVATANAVEYMGGRPVFCDIDLNTFNISTKQIEALITPRTVGIIPVHLFGLCADMKPILKIAHKHGLWVVEDAACAFGAYYHDRHAGSFGDTGCFSFHPRKSITTGEGGMITTQSEHVDRLVRSLRDHGASHSVSKVDEENPAFLLPQYNLLGYNYRMTDLQGALGCAQIDKAEWILSERARCARLYNMILADVPWLKKPEVPDGYVHGYQAYVCLFCPEDPTPDKIDQLSSRRKKLMLQLDAEGIATRQGTHAPIILGYYTQKYGLRPEEFPNAYLADRLSLALPLFPQMTEGEQARVCHSLKEAMDLE